MAFLIVVISVVIAFLYAISEWVSQPRPRESYNELLNIRFVSGDPPPLPLRHFLWEGLKGGYFLLFMMSACFGALKLSEESVSWLGLTWMALFGLPFLPALIGFSNLLEQRGKLEKELQAAKAELDYLREEMESKGERASPGE